MLNHFAHWVTLATLAVFVFIVPVLLLVKKSWRVRLFLAGWLLPGVIAFGWWYGPAFLPRPAPDVEGLEFTAANFNVMGFGSDPQKTFEVVKAIHADLIAFEEFRPALDSKLRLALAEEYPYQASWVNPDIDGLGLFSRYPIEEYFVELDPKFPHREDRPRYLRAAVNFQGQLVVVYVFHPTIPDLPPKLYLPFSYNDSISWAQFSQFVPLIAAEKDPVLVLCDCNATPHSRQYALLHRYLNEAYGERGWGFGLTFPADHPMIRIDYVWYSDAFEALEAKVWSTGGTSDHRPLWTRLILKKDHS